MKLEVARSTEHTPPPYLSGVRLMRPFYLAVTTLVPGLFTSMALLVLADLA